MATKRQSERKVPTGAFVIGEKPVGEILVMMPAGMEITDDVVSKVETFLAWQFPDDRFALAPCLDNHDHGFVAMPMAGLVDDFVIEALPKPTARKLNEIADALEDFRAAGWRRRLN